MFKSLIHKTVLRPPYVRWCSQTIYQALLAAIKIYRYSNDDIWKERALDLKDILIKIQQPDGGFDIGYDFNFGLLHKKGESTSPECVSLVALIHYAEAFGISDDVWVACDKCARWIVLNAIGIDNDRYYIPYSPYSTKDVMVYNGTSFACGALGMYIGFFKITDEKIIKIYSGFIRYLSSVLISIEDYKGKFWPYYDLDRTDIDEKKKEKIDFYHQMQQVEMHSFAQKYVPNHIQLDMINSASLSILDLYKDLKYLPYTNNEKDFGGHIHLWGLASVISGLQEYKKLNSSFTNEVYEAVNFVYDLIINKSWNKQYFYPIISKDNKVVYDLYMVRSDAWVINSLAGLLEENYDFLDKGELMQVLNEGFKSMEKVNFSGQESHASNQRTRFIGKLIKLIK